VGKTLANQKSQLHLEHFDFSPHFAMISSPISIRQARKTNNAKARGRRS